MFKAVKSKLAGIQVSFSPQKLIPIKVSKASAPEYRLCFLAIAAIIAGGVLVEQQLKPRRGQAQEWQPDPSVVVDPSPEITLIAVPKGKGKTGSASRPKHYVSKESCEMDAQEKGSPPEVLETLCWGLPQVD